MSEKRTPAKSSSNSQESLPARIAGWAVEWSGTTAAFCLAVIVILVWILSGPLFQFSDTWQLVINTGTTIVTFLMVFLLQRAQNKDSKAIHVKLNELVSALQGASNRIVGAECMTEEELKTLADHYTKLIELAKKDRSLNESHSVEEAEERHVAKTKARKA